MAISFFDLTDAQIIELTQKDIDRYVDYECAVEGIPLLPEKPAPIQKPADHEPDAMTYTLPEITVATQEEANKIINLLSELKLVKTSYIGRDYNCKYIYDREDLPQLETKRVFSKETYDRIGDNIEKQKEIQAEYEEKQTEYNRAERDRKEIVERVKKTLKEVQLRQEKKSYLRLEWARYKDLAEGDVEIAYNFMIKVHKDMDKHPDLIEEFQIDRLMNS